MATLMSIGLDGVANNVELHVSQRIERDIPTADNAYIYTPLQPGQVRVLVLLPATTFAECIRIKIHAIELEDIVDEFEALSYTWGAPNPLRQIFCDGQSITVSPNLYDALQALRSYGDAGVPRILWIDQLTINQADYEEKNVQVARMRDIYAAAKHVMVWLSKEIWEEEDLVDSCKEFSEFCNLITLDNEDSLPSVSKRSWQAIVKIYGSTAYFRRVWIIQEILCSKVSWFLIGRSCIPWDEIEIMGSSLQSKIELISNRSQFILEEDLLAGFRTTTRCFGKLSTMWTRLHMEDGEMMGIWGNKWTLLDLIRKSFKFEATEPKDKVYAMAGILKFSDHCVYRNVRPDYSPEMTYDSLIKQVFIWGFTEDGGLTQQFNMPWAWVTKGLWKASGSNLADVTRVPCLDYALSFRATKIARLDFTTEAFQYNEQDNEQDDGIPTVAKGDEFFHSSKIDLEEVAEFVASCWKLVNNCFGEHIGDMWMDFTKAFTIEALEDQTLTAMEMSGVPTSETTLQKRENDIRMHMRILRALVDQEIEAAFDLYHQIPHLRKKLLEGIWMRFSLARKVFQSPEQKSLERSSKDSTGSHVTTIMCWTPPDAKPGDMVYIIDGLRIPMVVREVEGYPDRYQFVGPCYAHGYMFGEVVSESVFHSERLIMV